MANSRTKLKQIVFKFDPNSTANEGRWRLKDPNHFLETSYRRWKTYPRAKDVPETEGIQYIVGKNLNDGGKLDCQAIRFSKKHFTEAQAAEWWAKYGHAFERTWQWDAQ